MHNKTFRTFYMYTINTMSDSIIINIIIITYIIRKQT